MTIDERPQLLKELSKLGVTQLYSTNGTWGSGQDLRDLIQEIKDTHTISSNGEVVL